MPVNTPGRPPIGDGIKLIKDPMDLSFCNDITIKYTPNKLNPVSNLLEACEELSKDYVELKKERISHEKRKSKGS